MQVDNNQNWIPKVPLYVTDKKILVPKDLWHCIFNFVDLDGKRLVRLERICKLWRLVIRTNEQVWISAYKNTFFGNPKQKDDMRFYFMQRMHLWKGYAAPHSRTLQIPEEVGLIRHRLRNETIISFYPDKILAFDAVTGNKKYDILGFPDLKSEKIELFSAIPNEKINFSSTPLFHTLLVKGKKFGMWDKSGKCLHVGEPLKIVINEKELPEVFIGYYKNFIIYHNSSKKITIVDLTDPTSVREIDSQWINQLWKKIQKQFLH